MDIVVTGRQLEISDRFRTHLTEKLSKVEQMAHRAQRLDVHVSHEKNPRQSESRERVEITVWGKGPVIRAEAAASDKYAALDLSYAKLVERLRRDRDRRKIHHGRRRPRSVAETTGPADAGFEAAGTAMPVGSIAPTPEAPSGNGSGAFPDDGFHDDAFHDGALEEGRAQTGSGSAADETAEDHPPADAQGDCPALIREKVFPGQPISLDEALARMELVGHDFYLFVDTSSGHPSVVYRRHGWSYGVIALDPELTDESGADGESGTNGSTVGTDSHGYEKLPAVGV